MEVFSNINKFLIRNPGRSFIIKMNKGIREMSLLFIFEGKMDQEVIKKMTGMVANEMNKENDTVKVQRLMFHVIVELLQNIGKYSDDEIGGEGIIIIGKTLDGYYISSGNVIANEKKSRLISSIEIINGSDEKQLKKQYEDQISKPKENEQQGAGLGLIDIAKKTKQKLQYNFELLNNSKSFFLITVHVLK